VAAGHDPARAGHGGAGRAPGRESLGGRSRVAGACVARRRADRFLQEVRDNLPGTIGDVDTEFLHDVRVAVRRTRSLLKLGRPALPAQVREAWELQFKWLGDLTTPVRDLDVYQLGLPERAGWLVAASAADLEPFHAYLARRRAADRRTLLRALRGARLRRLLEDWAGKLSALADSARAAEGATWSAGALARANVVRAHRRVVRGGTSICDSSPPEDLHVLRKRSSRTSVTRSTACTASATASRPATSAGPAAATLGQILAFAYRAAAAAAHAERPTLVPVS
jgi:CHAD domain